ncbi:unnamed protein product [Aphanomyces euteiches]
MQASSRASIVISSDVAVSFLPVDAKRANLQDRIQSLRVQQAVRVSKCRRSSIVSMHEVRQLLGQNEPNDQDLSSDDCAQPRLSLSPIRRRYT